MTAAAQVITGDPPTQVRRGDCFGHHDTAVATGTVRRRPIALLRRFRAAAVAIRRL